MLSFYVIQSEEFVLQGRYTNQKMREEFCRKVGAGGFIKDDFRERGSKTVYFRTPFESKTGAIVSGRQERAAAKGLYFHILRLSACRFRSILAK